MKKDKLLTFFAFILLGVFGLFLGMNVDKIRSAYQEEVQKQKLEKEEVNLKDLATLVLPEEGFSLSVSWGDIGPRLVELGVIDLAKFESAVEMTDEEREILTEGSDAPITISHTNSQFVVDVLWALGLAQESLAYTEGPLGTEYKAEAGNFASTGGWNLAKEDALNYLNKFNLIDLDEVEQARVKEIAMGVYRPCCGNSTWFPDCNHGMAALAAIELLVDAGLPDEEIYKEILKLNSFWFPDTYLITAVYFERQGISWDKIDAKEVLGEVYSSGRGAAEIAKEVGPLPTNEIIGGSCGA